MAYFLIKVLFKMFPNSSGLNKMLLHTFPKVSRNLTGNIVHARVHEFMIFSIEIDGL